MRSVLHLNASSGGGAFVVAQRLSDALNAGGEMRSEHLVYTGKPGNYELWTNTWLRRKYAFGLHALEKLDFLRYEKDKSVRFAFSHGLTGIDIAKNPLVREADILHLHWINKGFVSLAGLKELLSLGKPVVWTCHDMWPFTGGCYYSGTCTNYLRACGDCKFLKDQATNDLSARKYALKKEIFSGTNNLTFITPSAWLKEIGNGSNTAAGKEIHVIPNGIDTEIFKPVKSEKKEKFTLLFAAVNIADKRKGFAEFQQYCKALLEKGFRNFRVVYIGENKGQFEPDPAFEQAFTGYISDPAIMAKWYSEADLYVTTSNDDNLPTTVMESLACGTPVAAFAVGGIPEMILDGATGVLANVYDSENLASKTMQLLKGNFDDQQKIRLSCRSFAVENYDRFVVAKRHLDLYNGLLK
jgi:glycosyltransferase involved in cell wall biosynthesis